MNDWLIMFDDFSAAWADAVVRACSYGGLAIVLVWGLCRLLPKMPAAGKCWLWRLAYLKLFVALLWATPIALPLLPAPVLPAESASPAPAPADVVRLAREGPRSLPLLGENGRHLLARSHEKARASSEATAQRTLPAAASWLLAAWLVAAAWQMVQVLRKWQEVRHLVAGSRQLTDSQLTAWAAQTSRQLGLRRAPPLKTSDQISGPSLVGVVRPAVLLPSSLLQACSPAEIRLALAHELAHLKRRDLLWNWLPTLAEVLFFFHPLVWLARREWRLVQELACDEAAAIVSRGTAAELGRLMLRIAAQRSPERPMSLLTARVSASFSQIRRRLNAMKSFNPTARRRRMVVAAAVCILVGLGGVVPWRVTAQASRPAGASSSAAAPSSGKTVGPTSVWPREISEDLAAQSVFPNESEVGAGRRQPPAGRSGRDAVVDLRYLFEHNKHFAESLDDLKNQARAARAKFKQGQEEIRGLLEKLKGLGSATAEYKRLEEEIAQRRAELEIGLRSSQKRWLRQEAKAYETAYDQIVDAVEQFAKTHDIAVVYRKDPVARSKEPDASRSTSRRTSRGTSRRTSDQVAAVDPAPTKAQRSAVARAEKERAADDYAASVVGKISQTVVYRREDRWDITQDILELLDRKQTEPEGKRHRALFR